MIRRMFWLAAGVTIGVIAVRKVAQAKANLGPEGLNSAVGQLSDSIGGFADSLKSAMAERETDLRAALGIEAPAAPDASPAAVPASSRRALR